MSASVEIPNSETDNRRKTAIERVSIRIEGPVARRVLARGRGASAGRVRGRARLVSANQPLRDPVPGAVLICDALTPDLLPQLAYASAVVADRGSPLSRGATQCREQGIPCIVAAAGATRAIADGRVIEVDGVSGEVSSPV